MTVLRIVLVEDDALIAMLLGEMLADLGHDVCAIARTEGDAIAAAARHAPNLMIVDVQLTSGNGASAMQTILRAGPMPHFYITGGELSAVPPGAAVLHKPFGEADLVLALRAAIGGMPWTVARHAPAEHQQPAMQRLGT